ncbi:ABC transporter family substrate-binding protein [Nigerium massiliense]|uniref:ABC transporter family substrate-binding protein n=1 Tax=Nigerium massiliense TaxID=1522317 RepID=UPI0005914236|nr:ABC transporter family substrate-binding protein [Nigerium massiliense]
MSNRKLLAAAAAVAAGALALAGCSGPTTPAGGGQSAINNQQVATVAWNQPFYSYNNDTSSGNNVVNANIKYLTNEWASHYDQDLKYVQNPGFAKYEKVSDNPLKVKITLADTATWSDNTPVTAADVVMQWAANSSNFNTYEAATDDEGNVKADNTGSNVFFNASSPGYALIKAFPEIGDNNKSVTFTYSKPFVDWETLAMQPTGLPAHIVAKKALGVNDPTQAAQAVIDAFQKKDNAALAKLSNVWNKSFDFVNMPADKDLVVSNGPYTISDLKENQYITVTKNPNYKGDHKVSIDTITVRFIDDPQASVQALQNGEVLVTQPQATADIKKQLEGLGDSVNVLSGQGATYEHVDMVFNNGGPFDPKTYGGDANKAKLVRQAFLQTIPRQDIVDKIIKPLNPDATVRNSLAVVPGSPNYADAEANNGMKAMYGDSADVNKAKQLLSQAGVTAPSVRLLYANNNTRRQQEYQLIKASAEQAGFKIVDKGSKDWSTMLPNNKQYDASLFGWQSTSTGVSESDANFRTKGQNNYGGYSSKAVDGKLNELQVATDPAQQKTILNDVEKQLVQDAFGLSIYQFPEVTGVSKKLQNVSSIPLSPTYFWNYWEWKL